LAARSFNLYPQGQECPIQAIFMFQSYCSHNFCRIDRFHVFTGSVFRAVAYVYRQIWLLIHLTCFQIVVLFQDKQLDNVNVLGD
jgi:hypothetical protein